MLKQEAYLLTKIAQVIDIALIITAFVASYTICKHFTHLRHFSYYSWILIFIIPVWLILLNRYNLYASLRSRRASEIVVDLMKVHFFGCIFSASLIYFYVPQGYSRLFFASFVVLCFISISIGKLCVKKTLGLIRLHGYNTRNILIVGTGERSRELIDLIEEHSSWGLRIVGIACENNFTDSTFCGKNVLGYLNELPEICMSMPVDEVVWCCQSRRSKDDEYFCVLTEMGVAVRIVLDYYDFPYTRSELSVFHGKVPIITFQTESFDAAQKLIKRSIDILGSLAGLGVTLLILPFIALAIRMDSPGPIFFSQERVGKNGRRFRLWKFRSMYIDAEKRKTSLMSLNEMQGAMFKINNDPRITRVGRFLRRTSLDELPQFWNVLCGKMSLVGTRPPTPDEVSRYEYWHRKRISIKPGITGLWQVSGRNKITDFDEVAKLDICYIHSWGIWKDISILFKTFWVVLSRNGSR
jgi:exopolysaccharide biosynthesis polyprenyl glycosylphosphotransferase